MTEITLPDETVAHLKRLEQVLGERNVNGYFCDVCGATLITRHADPGVTPAMLSCRKTPGCNGMSGSLNYPRGPVPTRLGVPTHEWYRPDQEQFDTLNDLAREHIMQGGLLLREVSS